MIVMKSSRLIFPRVSFAEFFFISVKSERLQIGDAHPEERGACDADRGIGGEAECAATVAELLMAPKGPGPSL